MVVECQKDKAMIDVREFMNETKDGVLSERSGKMAS